MGRLLRWLAVLTLTVTACSIQAPVEVVSSDGGQAASNTDDLAASDGETGDITGVDAGTGADAGGATGSASGGASGASSGATASGPRTAANGATDTGVSADKIRVGSLFALSGPVSSISAPILYGVSSYFRKINASGGVGGRKVELVYYDDGYDPQRGVGLIRRLIEQDKVFSLVTVPSSSSLEAATQYIESQKVPVIGTSGLVETQFKAPMQFPVGASTVVSTHAGLKYINDRFKPKNVAIIYVDLLAGEYARKATEGAASRLGFQVCSKQKVPLSQPDYGPVWLNVRSDCGDTVDYVLLAIDPSSAIKALTAAKNQRFKPAKGWGGGATLFLDLVVKGVGAYGIGLGASTSFIPPVGKYLNEPAVKEYVETVRKYSPSGIDVTNPYLEGGYVGAALAVEAFKRSGANLTRASVVNILNNLENWTIGLSRPLTFKGGNKYANNSLLMAEIADEGGKLQYKVVSDFIADPWPGQDTSL